MSSDNTLAGEIQRKAAEIDDWPIWAKPYEQHPPDSASQASTAVGGVVSRDLEEPQGERP
jgi:hypothetical protein